jgi:hypothetical protein
MKLIYDFKDLSAGNLTKLLVLCVIGFTFISCQKQPNDVEEALKKANTNKDELQKVLDYYGAPKDSLKLRAAYFLIANMPNKSHFIYSKAQQKVLSYIDSLHIELGLKNVTEINDNYRRQYEVAYNEIIGKWDKLKHNDLYPSIEIKDIDVITADILIENIDYAFKVWEKVPWSAEYGFEEFCEYVLPYRTRYDIPVRWRKEFYSKYKWLLDSVHNSSDFLYASKLINESLNWGYNPIFNEFYNTSILDVANVNIGVCRQHTALKIAILRSVGIPAADISGLETTTWAVVPDENKKFWGWEDIQPPLKGSPYIDTQRYIEYPKVYEYTYKIQDFPFNNVSSYDIPQRFYDLSRKDVTKHHTDFTNVSIELTLPSPKQTDYVFLCVFNRTSKKWEAAHWGKIDDNKAYFDQMGLGCVYLPMYFSNRRFYPAAAPFYLDKDNKKTVLKADVNVKKSVALYRKCYMKYWDNRNSDLMVNDVFEGASNKNFTDAKILYTIKEKPVKFENKKTATEQKFRYVRYRGEPTKPSWINEFYNDMEIAEIGFYDENNNKLTGTYLASSIEHLKNIEFAFDANIRTNFVNKTGELNWIGLDLGVPKSIKFVKYLFRNSFNIIEPGDDYELFYWDNEWKSLGVKTAKDNYVMFDVPERALLWLRNITKGKEESLFIIENGKQKWVY